MTATAISAAEECDTVAASIKGKANKYKRMSKWSTLTLTAVTAAIPVVIVTVGSDIWGKVVPSALAALATFIAAFIQIEKPQERWSLYRRYQRIAEAESLKFKFKAAPYNGKHSEEILAKAVAQLQLDLHDEWAGLVPRSADFKAPVAGTGVRP